MNYLVKKVGIAGAAFGVAALVGVSVFAADTVVVTPAHTQGWYEGDVRAGGAINFVNDPSSPYPTGALQLTTDSTNEAKAQYLKDVNTPLADVENLSYYTKQVSGAAVADPSFQVLVDLNGGADGGFTTLVYEPYWNGVVTPGTWQQWDVNSATAQLWSSKSFSEGTCTVVAGSGGPPFYNLPTLSSVCPDAEVLSIGVNVGTFNPNYVVETDGVTFNNTTYDFELANSPTNKTECKNDGWQNLTDSNGNSFANQGDCVSFVATGGRNTANTHGH